MYLLNNQPKLSFIKTIKIIRDYKNFDNSCFAQELLSEIKILGPLNKIISIFHNVCIEIIVKYVPGKQKYIRASQANSMDIKLNHTIILRSELRNKFLKSRSNKDRFTRNNKTSVVSE